MEHDYGVSIPRDEAYNVWCRVDDATDPNIKYMLGKLKWRLGYYRCQVSPDTGSLKIIVFWKDEKDQIWYRLLDKPPGQ